MSDRYVFRFPTQLFFVVSTQNMKRKATEQQDTQSTWKKRVQKLQSETADSLVEKDFKILSALAAQGCISSDLWALWFFFRRKLIIANWFSIYLEWLQHEKPSKDSFG